jgi:hypothetical protein
VFLIYKGEAMRFLKQLLTGAAVLAAAATVTALAAGGSSGTVVKVGPSNLGHVLVDPRARPGSVEDRNAASRSTPALVLV